MPQQHNNADVHSQVAITQTYGSTNDVNQNASKDSVYPGSGDNFHATQPTNQYYNYNNGIPDSGPSSSTNNQSHIYEQPPPYCKIISLTENVTVLLIDSMKVDVLISTLSFRSLTNPFWTC